MRLIIKEYVSLLKEKDELDLLLLDLLVQRGYIADNIPKTGNRQYGVDIQLHNNKELLLLVIKQGNIDRNVWDTNPNAIRQSLNEIRDVYIGMLTEREKKKEIRVIVAANGVREESIRANWKGYVEQNKEWDGKKITIEFWGIDDIVDAILSDYFNEYIFEESLQSFMRKALYFIEEPDYKNNYFEIIIDILLKKAGEITSTKSIKRVMTSLHLACGMICQYANSYGNKKISINVSEYLLIRYWNFLRQNNYFEKTRWMEWLFKFLHDYERWSEMYYQSIKFICEDPTLFPNYNVVENRVMLYESVGYLITYANFIFNFNREKASQILNSVIQLINYYPN